MLKFIKHHIESIAGIEIYPLISLGIFFIFFVGLIAYVLSMSKKQISLMESMPLDKENE